jgi:hypothetical protein
VYTGVFVRVFITLVTVALGSGVFVDVITGVFVFVAVYVDVEPGVFVPVAVGV